jgi:hypothetical protein
MSALCALLRHGNGKGYLWLYSAAWGQAKVKKSVMDYTADRCIGYSLYAYGYAYFSWAFVAKRMYHVGARGH